MSTIARFSLEHYEHMVESGAFAGPWQKRLELLRGEICMMSPIGVQHAQALISLTDWSYQHVDLSMIMIGVQTALRIPVNNSEPEPDLAWMVRKEYSQHHPEPADVLLVVEVADSSLQADRTDKLAIYAEAGIADYWIVNLIDRQIEVYRQPHGRSYQEKTVHGKSQAVFPLALPAAEITPARLFPKDV
jgi:Uma2 family endonuclease